MKRSVTQKLESSNQTGAKGSKLTELDHIVIDVIGRDSTYLNGLGEEDEPPKFLQTGHATGSKPLLLPQEASAIQGAVFKLLLEN